MPDSGCVAAAGLDALHSVRAVRERNGHREAGRSHCRQASTPCRLSYQLPAKHSAPHYHPIPAACPLNLSVFVHFCLSVPFGRLMLEKYDLACVCVYRPVGPEGGTGVGSHNKAGQLG